MTEDRVVEIKDGIRSMTEEYYANKREKRIKGDLSCEIKTSR